MSLIDVLLIPFIAISAIFLKLYRKAGSQRLSRNTRLLKKIGVFPIRDHYYEPLFNNEKLYKNLREKRFLPGIDFNAKNQLQLLESLTFQAEFQNFIDTQDDSSNESVFRLPNKSFDAGDAEFLFNYVRYLKPSKVIEVGCGQSTKIISHALFLNQQETGILSQHRCIEPYEAMWLDTFQSIEVIRAKIENVDHSMFTELEKNDLLFMDSSHIIRPQGDIIKEYLEIIPSLQSGVVVHAHDIFSPRDYLESWIRDNVFFWNEQYILEATLSNNLSYEIIAAVNFLKHDHFDALQKVCPFLTTASEPGSFYFQKI
ncbi:class I SAM-dependent methyltransferase [Gammaproteobacteria bacterium]|nr:class I SAM-dependent methyltransferase [Gammaproteobacteria bacterium]MDC1112664.1 class I SAM-dependent methyltransferase [bacterium]